MRRTVDVTVLYEVRRLGSDDLYIGISRNAGSRWSSHKHDAKRGRKTHLAASIRKNGADAFSFQVVASFPSREIALLAERACVHRMRPSLNMTGGGDAPPAKSAATREKIRAKAIGRCMDHLRTPEANAKKSARMKGRAPMAAVRAAAESGASAKSAAARRACPERHAAFREACRVARLKLLADPIKKAQFSARRRATMAAKAGT